MTASKARVRANAKYNAKTYDRLELKVLKGNKAIIQDYCKNKNISVNNLITDLLQERLTRDGYTFITRTTSDAEQSKAGAPKKVQEEPVLEIVQSKQSKVHRESDIDFKSWIYDLYMEYSEKEHAELLKEIRLYGESKGNSAQDHKFRIMLLKHAHIIEELPSKGCYRLIAE